MGKHLKLIVSKYFSPYTEKYYWDNRPDYYNNIGLGHNYYALHRERCITFLLLLSKALTSS